MNPHLKALSKEIRGWLYSIGLRLLRWRLPNWYDDPGELKLPGIELPIGILVGALIPGFIEIFAHGEYPEYWSVAVCLAFASGGLVIVRPEKWIKWGLYVGLGWALLIVARIIWEIKLDIASHNLFPFTVVSFAIVSLPSAFTGAIAGRFMIVPLLRKIMPQQRFIGEAIVLLAVSAGLAVALMRSEELTANEIYALEKVRALVTSQQRYSSATGRHTCDLSKLDERFDESIGHYGNRSTVTHNHYSYRLVCLRGGDSGVPWVYIEANPDFRDVRAHRAFCVNRAGQILAVARGRLCLSKGKIVEESLAKDSPVSTSRDSNQRPASFAKSACVSFDAERTEMRSSNGTWHIVADGRRILDFGSKGGEARTALRIIKHYGLNKRCIVGADEHYRMEYFLVDDRAPRGSALGEDCLGFDPARTEVAKVKGRWKIVDGGHWLLDFVQSENDAREALSVIQNYRFERICYVGRPRASMTYFRQ